MNELDLATTQSNIEEAHPIKVILIDDHEVVRQGLLTMLQKEKDLRIVGQAANALSGYDLVRESNPDVILLDIQLGGSDLDGFTLLQKIRGEYPNKRVLVLTGYDSELYLSEAIKARADGFILKEHPRSIMSSAIKMVLPVYVSGTPRFYRAMGNVSRELKEPSINGRFVNEKFGAVLTDKERLVFHLLAKGCANKDIGIQLKYTPATVKKYVYRCMKKLGVSNRTQLAVLAHNYGVK